MRNAGTKKLWITSSEVSVSLTGTPTGTCSSLISRWPVMCWIFHIQRLPTTWICIESFGTRCSVKNTSALHRKMTSTMPAGISVQASSSGSEPWISAGRSSSERRRNLTANTASSVAISTPKNTLTAIRKRYSASTLPAVVEAPSGKKKRQLPTRQPLPAQPQRHEARQQQQRQQAGCAQQPHHGSAVTAHRGVVLVTVEQHLVDRRPDVALRGLVQRQPQVLRRVLDAEQVVRDAALRRERDDAGRVRPLLRTLVPHVAEAHRLGQPVQLRLVPREEVPARLGPGSLVAPQVGRLLGGGQLRRLLRLEAHRDDLELLAHVEAQHRERAGEAVERERAQHRALVVHQRQHHRPLAEVVAEPHAAAGLVLQRDVERDLVRQLLLERDLVQRRRRPRHRQRRRHAAPGEQRELEQPRHFATCPGEG